MCRIACSMRCWQLAAGSCWQLAAGRAAAAAQRAQRRRQREVSMQLPPVSPVKQPRLQMKVASHEAGKWKQGLGTLSRVVTHTES